MNCTASSDNRPNKPRRSRGFTLVELVIVISIVGAMLVLLAGRLGAFTYWEEEAAIRRLSETLVLLHHQAVVDQSFYRIEFDFEQQQYAVGVLKSEDQEDQSLALIASDAGNLTLELSAFLSPAIGSYQTLIPPPSMPSLAEPVELPHGMIIEDIRTMRGKQSENQEDQGAYILFSPRGFSEFAVIHLRLSSNQPVTILVNPFTGLTDIFRDYKDFEWTYGQKQQQ